MQNYNEVPAIITCKDLDYLSDIFDWNFNTFKLSNHFRNEVMDEEIKKVLYKICDFHKECCKTVLNILQ